MPGLVIWKTQQVEKLRKDMDRMFARLWGTFGLEDFSSGIGKFPKIHLAETEEALTISAEMRDISPDDISIDLTEDTLSLKAEIKKNSIRGQNGVVRTEKRFESFSRKLRLPCPIVVEEVKATYREGILTIRMPKFRQKKSRTLKIES